MQLKREKAKCERLLASCEDAVLTANLHRVASADVVKRYEQMLSIEEGTLTDSARADLRPQTQSTASAVKQDIKKAQPPTR
jgi:hypothetical protein